MSKSNRKYTASDVVEAMYQRMNKKAIKAEDTGKMALAKRIDAITLRMMMTHRGMARAELRVAKKFAGSIAPIDPKRMAELKSDLRAGYAYMEEGMGPRPKKLKRVGFKAGNAAVVDSKGFSNTQSMLANVLKKGRGGIAGVALGVVGLGIAAAMTSRQAEAQPARSSGPLSAQERSAAARRAAETKRRNGG